MPSPAVDYAANDTPLRLRLHLRRLLEGGSRQRQCSDLQGMAKLKPCYLIVLEPTATGFSAYSPDVEGCVATGETAEETALAMQEALEFHIEGLRAEGYDVPAPSSVSAYVEVAV
jgi:predicted RNase H-like HicB family nuclease